MNSNITFVQNWLIQNENIISSVDDVRFSSQGWFGVHPIDKDDSTPLHEGSLVLTNHRLFFIYQPLNDTYLPRWYSVTCIAGLQERPPRYSGSWPYQARLTLYSGVLITIETPKDRIDERGKELSRFLNEAFISLNVTPKMGSQMAEFIEAEKRRRSN